jgi:nitrite reductase/ring-hydroxylating ferredoxin subunit
MRHDHSASAAGCDDCPLVGRRAFLTDVTRLAAGALLALGATPATAAALRIGFARGVRLNDDEHAFPIPAGDGATIDKDNQVIVVRYEQKAYAFNLSCPHQNTALRWYPDDQQFQCPKHHSRYRPDGIFISGRATRSMDRLGVRRDGDTIVVDLDKFYRQDKNPTEWAAAFIAL